MTENNMYLCIDLKSFYASVECIERGLDPMKTNLVVADASRTEKTICLAVSPSLKGYGIPGRPRLFEVVQKIKEVNAKRKMKAPKRMLTDSSFNDDELKSNPSLAVSYITATPRMSFYMKYSTSIYNIYLKYVAPEDVHVYSIDEVFIDISKYLTLYKLTAKELAMKMILDVIKETGITATAGIGTNMYLAKIAMDIHAKRILPDENGVRIAELDEMSYRKNLWEHTPITDFWRVGRGYTKKLEANGMFTMGDVARCSINNEEKLYKLFGINAELLIDHAWGWEPCTMQEVKNYKPESTSLGSGQVLQCPYDYEKARLIVWEMTDLLVLSLVEKGLVTDQLTLTVGYDIENLTDPQKAESYKGETTTDYYGRKIPKHAHGTTNLNRKTSSSKLIIDAVMKLYEKIVDDKLLVRRINVTANRLTEENEELNETPFEQLDMFTDYNELSERRKREAAELEKEKKTQKAVLQIQKKYGKNAAVKAVNLKEEATTMKRNEQIGGHKA